MDPPKRKKYQKNDAIRVCAFLWDTPPKKKLKTCGVPVGRLVSLRKKQKKSNRGTTQTTRAQICAESVGGDFRFAREASRRTSRPAPPARSSPGSGWEQRTPPELGRPRAAVPGRPGRPVSSGGRGEKPATSRRETPAEKPLKQTGGKARTDKMPFFEHWKGSKKLPNTKTCWLFLGGFRFDSEPRSLPQTASSMTEWEHHILAALLLSIKRHHKLPCH